jgi:hypothetical protein
MADEGQLQVVENDAGGLDVAVAIGMDRRQVEELVKVLSAWLEVTDRG